jgi:hypothetical protein
MKKSSVLFALALAGCDTGSNYLEPPLKADIPSVALEVDYGTPSQDDSAYAKVSHLEFHFKDHLRVNRLVMSVWADAVNDTLVISYGRSGLLACFDDSCYFHARSEIKVHVNKPGFFVKVLATPDVKADPGGFARGDGKDSVFHVTGD